MVRFIIINNCKNEVTEVKIYIPIWLDLLLNLSTIFLCFFRYLHSNMVRFIIFTLNLENDGFIVFTFQYG